MPHRKLARTIWANLAVIALLLVTVIAGIGWVENHQRSDENRDLIRQIQEQRVVSCERTYEGVREVFAPFMVPELITTPEQLQRVRTFNDTIDGLKNRCHGQTQNGGKK